MKNPHTPDFAALCPQSAGGVTAAEATVIPPEATATAAVNESNTAKSVGSGSLDVFATPMMIALMERAACACLADSGLLAEGQTSVGAAISVEHTAASPIGAIISATAAITELDGRRVEFLVTASDNTGSGGTPVGRGTHTRFIVDAERFSAKARAKLNAL